MFAAVAAHKFVIAFCIGIELIASRTNRILTVIYVCTFAIVSPLGIGIGMALTGSDTTATSGPLPVILQVKYLNFCNMIFSIKKRNVWDKLEKYWNKKLNKSISRMIRKYSIINFFIGNSYGHSSVRCVLRDIATPSRWSSSVSVNSRWFRSHAGSSDSKWVLYKFTSTIYDGLKIFEILRWCYVGKRSCKPRHEKFNHVFVWY